MKRPSFGPWTLRFLVLATCSAVASCQRTEPLDRSISARTPIQFMMWRSEVVTELTTAEWQDFDLAAQELKFQITIDHVATGTDAVNEAFLAEIDGQSIRHVIEKGLRAKLVRLQDDRDETARMIAENATIPTAQGDTDSIAALRDLHDRQTARLESTEEDIKSLKSRIREISTTTAETVSPVDRSVIY